MARPELPVDVLETAGAGRKVVRGGALRIGAFGAGTALSVVGVVLVTRHLGVVDYGRYQAVIALVAIVGSIGDAGLGTLALREHAQASAQRRDAVLGALLGVRLALAAVTVLLAVVAAVVLRFDATMTAGAALAAAGGVVGALQATATVPLQTELRMGTVAALELARQVLSTALLAALVLAGATLLPLLGVPLAVAVVLLALTLVIVRGVPAPVFDWPSWRVLLRDAAVVGLATAAGVVYLYTSLLVCRLVASSAETGWFSASFRVVIIVAAVPALLATTAFPLLARAAAQNAERFAAVANGLVEGSVLLGGAAALFAVLGAPAIIAVVAGPSFARAVDPLRIQGAALGATFAIAALGFTLLAARRQRALALCNLLAFATSAGAVAILAARWGERGAAAGAALAELVLCAAYARTVATELPLRPHRVPRILVALAGGLAAGALVPLPAVGATAVGLAVYGALAVALRAVPPDVLLAARPER
jgi:O-antigen/teichoic acid export membrane protein